MKKSASLDLMNKVVLIFLKVIAFFFFLIGVIPLKILVDCGIQRGQSIFFQSVQF